MKRLSIIVAGCIAALLAGPSWGAEPAPSLLAQLAGNTLSAVTYSPNPPGSHNGELARVMLQAYLRPDGRALVRLWDAGRGGYTAAVERRWSLEGNKLCLDLPNQRFCAEVHVWGPRIAGAGAQPYAMLDGDLRPGNAITGTR